MSSCIFQGCGCGVLVRFFWANLSLQNGSPYAIGPLVCLSVLSVTLACCGQTVRWIKMPQLPRAAEVGLGPGHIVLVGLPPFQREISGRSRRRGSRRRSRRGIYMEWGVYRGDKEWGAPQPTRGFGERRELSQQDPGRSPGRK